MHASICIAHVALLLVRVKQWRAWEMASLRRRASMIIADHEHRTELGTSPSTESTIQSGSRHRFNGTKRGDSGTTWRGLTEHQVLPVLHVNDTLHCSQCSCTEKGFTCHESQCRRRTTGCQSENSNNQEQQQTPSAVRMVKPKGAPNRPVLR